MKYWNEEGKHQALYEKLNNLIPSEGEVPNAKGANRALEKLRVAANCYYDLYNNGLINRAAEFRRVFGFGGSVISKANFNHPLQAELDARMDEIILAAAAEQNLLSEMFSAEQVLALLKKQKFADWYNGQFENFITGEEGCMSEEEIVWSLKRLLLGK